MKITHASHLSDIELVTALGRLAQSERDATVALIVHLAEFDGRRLYERAGYSSLLKYCRAVLRLSEDAVYNRIASARAARRYPVVVEMLIAGSLSPTTARLLARHLTPEDQEELLAAAAGLGKEDVEELLARWFPEPDVAPRVRKLPTPHVIGVAECPAVSAPGLDTAAGAVEAALTMADSARAPITALPSQPRPLVRPLAPDRYEIRFTATAEIREKLRLAQDLLGHAIPSGDLAQVFDRALTVLIEDLKRKKFAATPRPRPTREAAEGSRHIPASVRRAVGARDEGRCAFSSARGYRCGERRFLASIPPRRAVCGGRSGDGREHPVAMSRVQRPRSRPLLRSWPTANARRRRPQGACDLRTAQESSHCRVEDGRGGRRIGE